MAIKIVAMQQTFQVVINETSGPAAAAKFAAFAKAKLAEVISSGQGSPTYTRTVNGRLNAPEESVKLPGPIVYRFSWLDEVVMYALEFLRARSPVGPPEEGHYQESHEVLVNGVLVGDSSNVGAFENMRFDASEIVISNNKPYSRKIEVGAMTMTVMPRIYENARKAVNQKYSQLVRADVRFISRSDGFVLAKPSRRQLRRGRGSAREELTYPALILNLRD